MYPRESKRGKKMKNSLNTYRPFLPQPRVPSSCISGNSSAPRALSFAAQVPNKKKSKNKIEEEEAIVN
jgi:hypothetical protein